ncbi:HAD-IA family hydrolase [Cryobacterium serini]|uniref:HAD family hydrolase n=1 Tax=Cryobacterium serini TaxID=1259201 RepID=A0A4R9BM41_9MICO|nr:HAD-IA family hydrolase [Cryobacterium serini]TFD86023.1 HAD family hydrolase [Cryobacterium serini]
MPALIFDCDGVLADTEQYGHLPAFNQTFREFGLPVQWSVQDYADKVRISGGKERLMSLVTPEFAELIEIPDDPTARTALVAAWHRRKTEIYTDLIEGGVVPARPGIDRIVREASAAGWTLAVASTSAEPSVRAVLTHAVGPEHASQFAVFAGDIVAKKKPEPDIYLHALAELGISLEEAIVIEDSENGLRSATTAGLRTVVTVSSYTFREDFSAASLVVSSLGDPNPGEMTRVIADPYNIDPGPFITLRDLAHVAALSRPKPQETQ